MEESLELLKLHWGFDNFRGIQENAINATLNGKDVFVRMATGAGKSICYQISGIVRKHTTIVVSPLISLMKDQVMALQNRDIKACFLGSSQTDKQIWEHLNDYKFIYITPEMATTDRFRLACNTFLCSLIAIDEAHCVSEWGHDFRPEYTQLKVIRTYFDYHIPIIALTATATNETKIDIIRSLDLTNVQEFTTTVDRENLIYSVKNKPQGKSSYETLAFEVKRNISGSTIIYVPTTKEVDELCEFLTNRSISCSRYHAKMNQDDRNSSHINFIKDKMKVIIATLAFGMGIDKPDVRHVLHWGPPKSIEAYYQQSGRAGRDGDVAKCTLWVTSSDWIKVEKILSSDGKQTDRSRNSLRALRQYCESTCCRRQMLSSYFDEILPKTCGTCDSCNATDMEVKDATNASRLLLMATQDCRGYFGITKIISCLRGIACNQHNWLEAKPSYGIGSHLSATELKELANDLRVNGLIQEVMKTSTSGHTYNSIALTNDGIEWLKTESSTFHQKCQVRTKRSIEEIKDDSNDLLYNKLSSLRKEIASNSNIPPYMVFSNATLREISNIRPTKLSDLTQISGIGPKKTDKYGLRVVQCIRNHIIEKKEKMNDDSENFPFSLLNDEIYGRLKMAMPTNFEEVCKVEGMSRPIASAHWEAFCAPHVSSYFM